MDRLANQVPPAAGRGFARRRRWRVCAHVPRFAPRAASGLSAIARRCAIQPHDLGDFVAEQLAVDARRGCARAAACEFAEAARVRRRCSMSTCDCSWLMKYSDSGIACAIRASNASRPSAPTSESGSWPSGRNRKRSWRPSRTWLSEFSSARHAAARPARSPSKQKISFVADAEDARQVLRRGRRAERRDRISDAGLMQSNDVHVAFNDEQPRQGSRRLARFVQAVQLAALVEQLGLRRVQVLGLALVEHAPAEADRAAARIADREHHAIAEAVVVAGSRRLALALDDQADLQQLARSRLARAELLQHASPRRRARSRARTSRQFRR